MASTRLGDTLEDAFGRYTEQFRFVVNASMFRLFQTYYEQDNIREFIVRMFQLHSVFEDTYQNASKQWFNVYRQAETGDFNPPVFASNKSAYSSVVTNFMIHGPQAIQRKEGLLGRPFGQWTKFQQQQSINHVSQSFTYKVMDAPRQNMIETVTRDTKTSQYVRKADSSACDFCKLLAARGPVYSKQSSKFRAHGSCGCSAIPVYAGYKATKSDIEGMERWIEKNKGIETKARRAKEAKNRGLKPKVITQKMKDGEEFKRTVYVKTEALKDAEKIAKMGKDVDKLKRDGQPYKKPDMTTEQMDAVDKEASDIIKGILKIK